MSMAEKPKRRQKGRGKTVKPICPHCGEDMRRAYKSSTSEGNTKMIPTGWECEVCKYKEWDKNKGD